MSKSKKNNLNPDLNEFYNKFKKTLPPAEDFIEKIRQGDKACLSRAITLIESTSQAHQQLAQKIIRLALPYAGQSFRLGITGVPGVGKSTFIDRLGTEFIKRNHKVAVLAIDPSSVLNKGSILGDKTRMENLVRSPEAFIRPSPSGNFLGGVGRKTRESIILCEAAGYDRIIVETVGVGQSEIYVHSMTDLFVLLKLPGAGDELQGIKRGIMEMADMIIINKADGDLKPAAKRAVQIFKNALHLFSFRPVDQITVTPVSSLTGEGIGQVTDIMEKKYRAMLESGELHEKRNEQLVFWFEEQLNDMLKNLFVTDKKLRQQKETLLQAVEEGKMTPFDAAEKLWKSAFGNLKK